MRQTFFADKNEFADPTASANGGGNFQKVIYENC